jgi:hypothetical protein
MKKYWIVFVCLGLIATAGLLNGAMDKLQFHYSKSVFPKGDDTLLGLDEQYWNPAISWKNKYKDWPEDPRPAFPGAITWGVFLTDAWHLLKWLMLACYNLAILLPIVYLYRLPRWVMLVAVVPLNLFFGTAFTVTFTYLLARDRATLKLSNDGNN